MNLRNCDYNTGGLCPQPLLFVLHDTVILSVKAYHSHLCPVASFSLRWGICPSWFPRFLQFMCFMTTFCYLLSYKKKKVSRFPLSWRLRVFSSANSVFPMLKRVQVLCTEEPLLHFSSLNIDFMPLNTLCLKLWFSLGIKPGTKLISAHYATNAQLHLRMFSKVLRSHYLL